MTDIIFLILASMILGSFGVIAFYGILYMMDEIRYQMRWRKIRKMEHDDKY